MLKSITGIYKDGKIEPAEAIPFKTERRVIITFLPDLLSPVEPENKSEQIPPGLISHYEKVKKHNKISPQQFLRLINNDHVWDETSIQAVEQAKDSINQWKIEQL